MSTSIQIEFDLVFHMSESLSSQTKVLEEMGLPKMKARELTLFARKARDRSETYRVRVTLAQFALFMITRNDYGLKNRFKELNASVVPVDLGFHDFTKYATVSCR